MISDFNIETKSRTLFKTPGAGSEVSCFRLVFMFLGLAILLVNGCITSFEPKIEKYDKLLVVDGILTNLPGSCSVKLSRTYPYNQRHNSVEKNANVKIIDNFGNETTLPDNDDGVYLPEDKAFSGIIGRKYKISITTTKGEVCESEFEEINEPVDIGNIYYEYVLNSNETSGLNLFVDTEDPQRKSFYYSWDYDETWEFWVPYASMSVYLPESKICYNDVASRKILIESTKDYAEDKVVGFPLYFISGSTNRLSIKYSVLVRQYILNEKTYKFYKDLKNINENTGTLFDATPVILTGNITNISTPEQPVLGNFQVSGASEKRIFIHRSDLPADLVVPSEYEFCKGDLLSIKTDRRRIDSLFSKGWAVMDTIIDSAEKDTLLGLVISRSCFDCTTKGKIKKPEFWDEN